MESKDRVTFRIHWVAKYETVEPLEFKEPHYIWKWKFIARVKLLPLKLKRWKHNGQYNAEKNVYVSLFWKLELGFPNWLA